VLGVFCCDFGTFFAFWQKTVFTCRKSRDLRSFCEVESGSNWLQGQNCYPLNPVITAVGHDGDGVETRCISYKDRVVEKKTSKKHSSPSAATRPSMWYVVSLKRFTRPKSTAAARHPRVSRTLRRVHACARDVSESPRQSPLHQVRYKKLSTSLTRRKQKPTP
jgi:hypothetical protein